MALNAEAGNIQMHLFALVIARQCYQFKYLSVRLTRDSSIDAPPRNCAVEDPADEVSFISIIKWQHHYLAVWHRHGLSFWCSLHRRDHSRLEVAGCSLPHDLPRSEGVRTYVVQRVEGISTTPSSVNRPCFQLLSKLT